MLVAEKLRKENRAEYLLYMWQLEDLMRACGCDLDRLKASYLGKFSFTEELRKKAEQWYADLIDMMRAEGVTQGGHLQINRNVVSGLTDLHEQILASPKFSQYHAAYYKVLPYIVELRSKSEAAREEPELETCFRLLYGVMMLRLQQKAVTEETERAAKEVAALLRSLADYDRQNRESPLNFD